MKEKGREREGGGQDLVGVNVDEEGEGAEGRSCGEEASRRIC